MKKLFILFSALVGCVLHAGEVATTSLAKENAIAAAPFCENLVRRAIVEPIVTRPKVARRDSGKRLVSKMPVVQPPTEVDKKMPIKTPDTSTDYKLSVKTPEVESLK